MSTVQGVVDRVGPTLLRVVQAPSTSESDSAKVTDVVIAEPGKRAGAAEGDLLLGVAVSTAKEASALVKAAAEAGAAGVLLKPPITASVRGAAKSARIALVEVHTQAAWAQLVWLLRTVLDAEETGEDEADKGAALGDLFRLADAVAAMVDAPVTIEDANSRVLAYSARQDITDPARISTVMGRRQPDHVLAKFRSRGVFRQLSKGHSAIFVPAQPDGTLPRLIVPIRMGGELLGSMWAVVTDRVSDERAAAFADAGPVVALHLLRRRARTDTEQRRYAEALRGLLDGTGSPRLAVAELGLPDVEHRVVAIDAAGRDNGSWREAEGARLALFDRITSGLDRLRAVTEIGGVLYVVIPANDWGALRETLGHQPLVGAGSPCGIGALHQSRAQADETLLLLRAELLPGHVATHERAWTVLALHRAAAAAGPAGVADLGPITQLRAADDSTYLDTLYAWLRHAGDPRAAAKELQIHPNTLRYRVRKIVELTGVDLDDADTRMALLTQLVTLRWA